MQCRRSPDRARCPNCQTKLTHVRFKPFPCPCCGTSLQPSPGYVDSFDRVSIVLALIVSVIVGATKGILLGFLVYLPALFIVALILGFPFLHFVPPTLEIHRSIPKGKGIFGLH